MWSSRQLWQIVLPSAPVVVIWSTSAFLSWLLGSSILPSCCKTKMTYSFGSIEFMTISILTPLVFWKSEFPAAILLPFSVRNSTPGSCSQQHVKPIVRSIVWQWNAPAQQHFVRRGIFTHSFEGYGEINRFTLNNMKKGWYLIMNTMTSSAAQSSTEALEAFAEALLNKYSCVIGTYDNFHMANTLHTDAWQLLNEGFIDALDEETYISQCEANIYVIRNVLPLAKPN